MKEKTPLSTSSKSIAKAAGILFIAGTASKVLGMVRDVATMQIFGNTPITDAYYAAFSIPDFMYLLVVGGALSAAFIPVFTEYLAKKDEAQAWEMATSFLVAGGLLLFGIALLGMLFARQLAPIVAYKFSGQQLDLFEGLMRLMFPAVFFTSLAGLAMGVHFSYQRFLMPALGPVAYNVFIITGIYLLGPRFGVRGMAVGVLLGAMASFALQMPFVIAASKRVGASWRLDFKHPALRRVLWLMIPTSAGLGVRQLNLLVEQNLASGMGAGAITVIRNSTRLFQFPVDAFGAAVASAVFPVLTRQFALNDLDSFRRTFGEGIRSILFIGVPAGLGLFVLSEPIVRLLFEHGKFTTADTAVTAGTLAFYSLAVFSQAVLVLITRAFYAIQDTRTPVKVGFILVALGAFANIALMYTTNLGTRGLALVFTIVSFANFVVLSVVLKRRIGLLGGRAIARTGIKALAAGSAMALGSWAVAMALGRMVDVTRPTGQLLQVGAAVGVGIVIYVTLAWALRMEEVGAYWRLFRRRFVRKH